MLAIACGGQLRRWQRDQFRMRSRVGTRWRNGSGGLTERLSGLRRTSTFCCGVRPCRRPWLRWNRPDLCFDTLPELIFSRRCRRQISRWCLCPDMFTPDVRTLRLARCPRRRRLHARRSRDRDCKSCRHGWESDAVAVRSTTPVSD